MSDAMSPPSPPIGMTSFLDVPLPQPIGTTSTVPAVAPAGPQNLGGGDLNGSGNTVHMKGGSVGGNGTKTQVPRQLKGSGNYTGVV